MTVTPRNPPQPETAGATAGTFDVTSDPTDPRLDDFRDLVDTRHRRRFEQDRGLVIAEGFPLIERLLAHNVAVRTLLTTPTAHDRLATLAGNSGGRILVAPASVINEVLGFEFRRGAIASFTRPARVAVTDLVHRARKLAILEGINDAENVGSIFRAAAAFGVDGVVIDHATIDPYYRRSIRVSMGAAVMVPHAVTADLPEMLADLHAHAFTTIALTTNRTARPITAWDRAPRTAVLLGAEGPGLQPRTIAAAQHELTIPITDRVDSLNVAHAAAVAFFHLLACP